MPSPGDDAVVNKGSGSASWAEEWASFRQIEGWSAAGRHRDVLDALGRLPDELREGRTRSALLAAEANGRLGNYVEAERWADLAGTLARTRGEAHAELRARNYRGAIALRRGEVSKAEDYFTAALDMARALHDHTAEARALNNLGILANIRGDPVAALAEYRRALVAYQQVALLGGEAGGPHRSWIWLCGPRIPLSPLGRRPKGGPEGLQCGEEA